MMLSDYPLQVQPTMMTCGPTTISCLAQYLDVSCDDIGVLASKVPFIAMVGMVPGQFGKVLTRVLSDGGFSCERMVMTMDDVVDQLERGFPVPVLLLEDAYKNPHGDGVSQVSNLHYVTVIGVDDQTVTLANSVVEGYETISRDEFFLKRSLTLKTMSRKARLFRLFSFGTVQGCMGYKISSQEK